MSDYIERKAALHAINESFHDPKVDIALNAVPSADVRPVVHGRFVHDGPRFAGGVDWWHCGNCGSLVSGVDTRFAFCPHCGADMRQENDE